MPSRRFLRSWRCYSNLILNNHTLGLTDKKFEEREIYLIDKVGQILTNHYGNGVRVKTLELDLYPCKNTNASHLDRWLQITVKPGIEELNFMPSVYMKKKYSFPCSVLSDEAAASSIQSLRLFACAFNPTSKLGRLRRLKFLDLSLVHITEEGLGHFLSKSFALERLVIFACTGITSLRIPCTLQQLKFLRITRCNMMRVVEINAPNLCSFHYGGTLEEISVRNCSQLELVESSFCPSGILSYARARLPSIAQNVESLTLISHNENVTTPMLPSKFLHLKKLEIRLYCWTLPSPPAYDVFSLVSFLDASPTLVSFILRVDDAIRSDPVVGHDAEYLRRKPGYRHNSLRHAMITDFCSSKSLIELTIHILESAPSLERLTLDTTRGYDRRCGTIGKCPASSKIGQCFPICKRTFEEAHRAVEAAGRYIAGRVPSAVEFEVLELCSRCHMVNHRSMPE